MIVRVIALDAEAPFVRAVRAIRAEGDYDHAIEVLIPDYEEWVRAAIEVIRRKCERQLDDRRA